MQYHKAEKKKLSVQHVDMHNRNTSKNEKSRHSQKIFDMKIGFNSNMTIYTNIP